MKFHLRRKTHRGDNEDELCLAQPDPTSPSEAIEIDEWADAVDAGPALAVGGDISHLGDKLLMVLADEEASLVPPSAGDMTQAEWDALSDAEREGFRRLQLKRVDPRYVTSYTMNSRRPGSRSARVYR